MNKRIHTSRSRISSEVREEFDLSASDNAIAPSLPITFPEFSENE
jgi:hypothetical protein